MSDGLKIVQFTAENLKRLQAVSITPKGHMVPITGRNGQGKTTVLDAIWWALGGKDVVQEQPIRRGQTKARIELNLGEFIVEREFHYKKCSECKGTGEKINPAPSQTAAQPCEPCGGTGFSKETETTLKVKTKEGATFASPQKMLDALVGMLSFDPLEFTRVKPSEQFDMLRTLVKVDFDFAVAAKSNADAFSMRTDLNRQAKQQRATAAQITVPEGTPEEPVDEAAIDTQLRKAYETNNSIEIQAAQRKHQQTSIDQRVVDLNRRIEGYRKEIERMTAAMAEEQRTLEAVGEERKVLDALPVLPEKVDVDALQKESQEAKRVNLQVKRRQDRDAAVKAAEQLEQRAATLTEEIENRNAAGRVAVQAAKMPVEGLGLGEGYVTFNELPFEQASDAERLRVSVAIAMAANPRLRVLRIRDGSLLDEDSMKVIGEMATAGDYQFWVERVDATGEVGIVIEDGMVKADKQQEG